LNVGWNGYVDLVKITENFASITANRNWKRGLQESICFFPEPPLHHFI
jgi:hypothetical protein